MPTLTIRNVPEEVVQRLKDVAKHKGHSMEQEVRDLLVSRYTTRREVLERIRSRWKEGQAPTAEEIDTWIETGRP